MTPTDDKPRQGLSAPERVLGLCGAAIFLVMLGLFHVIQIDGAVIASGQAVVQGKPRPVQSLDGGIAQAIHVSDGDRVEAGAVLIELDQTLHKVTRDILRARLSELAARRARLTAESNNHDRISAPGALPGLDAVALRAQLAGQTAIFHARRLVRESQEAQLRERIAQFQGRFAGVGAQIAAAQNQSELLRQEISNLETLSARDLVPEARLLELQGRLAALEGQIVTLRSEADGNHNSIREAELEITRLQRSFREQVTTELREVVLQLDETQLELARIAAEMNRLEIRAPVGGVVHELQIVAAGGVVAPQEVLLSVIPVADGVEFNLELATDAIDSVYEGQEARLRFPAFNVNSTPEIFGEVSRLSPDSILDQATGRRFYRVAVAVPPEELARLGDAELVPGMPVEALLQTGSRSILSYLVKPITDQVAHAFREG